MQQGLHTNLLEVKESSSSDFDYIASYDVQKVTSKNDKQKNARYFIAGLFDKDDNGRYTRKNKLLKQRSLLILDFDDIPLTNDQFIQLISKKLHEFNYILYPSISHTASKPRYRLVVEPSRDITNKKEYEYNLDRLVETLELTADSSMKTWAQLQGLPVTIGKVEAYKKIVHRGGWQYPIKSVEDKQIDFINGLTIPEERIPPDDAIKIFKRYLKKESRHLTERNNNYLSVIMTLAKAVTTKEINKQTALACCELLANNNEAWKADNKTHLLKELQLANGNASYFTTAYSFMDKFTRRKQTNNQTIETVVVGTDEVITIELDKDGKAIDSLPNLENIVRSLFRIGFNEFTNNIEIIENGKVRQYVDDDKEHVRMQIAQQYNKTFKHQDIRTAVVTGSKFNAYHPIKNLIESKKWDGIPRAETFFIDYLGVEDTPAHREVTRKWLLGAVTRIYEEGCKFDMAIVLQGQQGIGKTTAINRLALGYATSMDEDIDKDVKLQVLQHWMVEIEEMNLSKNKKISNRVKKFISATVDDLRPPYGGTIQKYKRHSVFVGTTNDSNYLTDKTGNRRFYPLMCGVQEVKKPVFEVDAQTVLQIWAEVYQWYQSKESLLCSVETETYMNALRENVMEVDIAQELIEQFLEVEIPNNWNTKQEWEKREYIKEAMSGRPMIKTGDILIKRDRVSTREILSELFEEDITPDFRGNTTARRVHAVMQNVSGWEYKQYKQNGYPVRGFCRVTLVTLE